MQLARGLERSRSVHPCESELFRIEIDFLRVSRHYDAEGPLDRLPRIQRHVLKSPGGLASPKCPRRRGDEGFKNCDATGNSAHGTQRVHHDRDRVRQRLR